MGLSVFIWKKIPYNKAIIFRIRTGNSYCNGLWLSKDRHLMRTVFTQLSHFPFWPHGQLNEWVKLSAVVVQWNVVILVIFTTLLSMRTPVASWQKDTSAAVQMNDWAFWCFVGGIECLWFLGWTGGRGKYNIKTGREYTISLSNLVVPTCSFCWVILFGKGVWFTEWNSFSHFSFVVLFTHFIFDIKTACCIN